MRHSWVSGSDVYCARTLFCIGLEYNVSFPQRFVKDTLAAVKDNQMIVDNYINNIPVSCINRAAVEFHVPATLIVSVLSIERGVKGAISKNKNGTYDMGPMQINSKWLPTLKKHGYSENDIIYDACKNVYVGTWILASKISKNNELWKGVGDYHSRQSSLNYSYSNKVKKIFYKIIDL